MWNWAWLEEISSSNGDRSVCSNDLNVAKTFKEIFDDNSSDDDSREVCAIQAITHSVVFKCIRNLKKRRYQSYGFGKEGNK